MSALDLPSVATLWNPSPRAPIVSLSEALANLCGLQVEDEVKERVDVRPHSTTGQDNEKLNLLSSLLDVDDWNSALILLQALDPVLPVAYQPVAQAFCRHIQRFIDPLYRRVQVRASCL